MNPQKAPDKYTQSRAAYLNCEWGKAESLLNEWLVLHRGDVHAQILLGMIYCAATQYTRSYGVLHTALLSAQGHRNKFELGLAYNSLGNLSFCQRDFRQSMEYYKLSRQALGYSVLEDASPSDLSLVARLENNLGSCAKQLGDFEKALTHFQEAISYAKKSGDHGGLATFYWNAGSIHLALKKFFRARRHFRYAMSYASNRTGAMIEGLFFE